MTTSESKGRFFLQNESIRIDSHNDIRYTRKLRSANYLLIYLHIRAASVLRHFVIVFV